MPTLTVNGRQVTVGDDVYILDACRAAGVEVTLEEENGLVHVWQAFPGVPEAQTAVARIGAWLGDRLG